VLASDPAKFSRKFVEKDDKSGKFVIKDEYNSDYAYFYPPKGFPNLLEKGVGERFIEESHEILKTALGKYFGKTILYTFDDEPALPGYFHTHTLGWCSDFGEEFFKRKGYRVEAFFAEIAATPQKSDSAEVLQHRIDYCDVRSELFVERFLNLTASAVDAAQIRKVVRSDTVQKLQNEAGFHICVEVAHLSVCELTENGAILRADGDRASLRQNNGERQGIV
jgi:hypothetical protein